MAARSGEQVSPGSTVKAGGPWHMDAMVLADLPAVAAVEAASYIKPWTEGVFRDCLRAGYYARVLRPLEGRAHDDAATAGAAVQGQGIAGYGLLSVAAGEAHLLNLCVAPAYRGRGCAKVLLVELLAEARRRRVRSVFLEVRASNGTALALYSRAGFTQIGVRKGYYGAVGGYPAENALVLERILDP